MKCCPSCGRPYSPLSDIDRMVYQALGEGLTYAEIAERCDVAVSTVQKTIRVLEAQGLIARRPHKTRSAVLVRPRREY